MIAYFPAPYPDELFYSVLARYYVHSGHLSSAKALQELFKTDVFKISVEFSPKLSNELIETLRKIIPIMVFIVEHTMFPYYGRFIPSTEINRALNSVIGGNSFYSVFPKSILFSGNDRKLRYCPLCAKEDRLSFGETYWHRKHQIPEIEVCTKHKCRLINTKISLKNRAVSSLYSAEEYADDKIITDKVENIIELKIADYVCSMFDLHFNFRTTNLICDYLHSKLSGTEYLSVMDCKRDIHRLYNDLKFFYSSLKYGFKTDVDKLEKMFTSKAIYPYEVCLLANFLGISVDELSSLALPYPIKDNFTFNDMVFDLFLRGKTFRNIAKQLDTTYEYAYMVCLLKSGQMNLDMIRFDKAAYL